MAVQSQSGLSMIAAEVDLDHAHRLHALRQTATPRSCRAEKPVIKSNKGQKLQKREKCEKGQKAPVTWAGTLLSEAKRK